MLDDFSCLMSIPCIVVCVAGLPYLCHLCRTGVSDGTQLAHIHRVSVVLPCKFILHTTPTAAPMSFSIFLLHKPEAARTTEGSQRRDIGLMGFAGV